MELDKNKFSLAASGTMGILYVLCGIFVWLWPNFSLQLLGWLGHVMNLDKFLTVQVTLVGLFGGLVQVLIYTYIGAWLFAWLHNRFMKTA